MTIIRPPAVAGSFYPDDPTELKSMIQDFLAKAPSHPLQPKVLIVPHAGYVYSGAIAALGYKSIANPDRIKRVVLLGPGHRLPFEGVAAPTSDAFASPLGDVVVDHASIKALKDAGLVQELDAAHGVEHCLEVQLPFLQTVLSDFVCVPLLAGNATAEQVAAVMDFFWHDPKTLFIISSDLSHYHDYQTAQSMDQETAKIILKGTDLIPQDHACGAVLINGLKLQLKRHHLYRTQLELKNSGDVTGDKDAKVVGYGAFHLTDREEPLSQNDFSKYRDVILKVARESIAYGLRQGKRQEIDGHDYPAPLRQFKASFVTLNIDGALSGCIGSLNNDKYVIVDIADNAYAAAFSDPRFPKLTKKEFDKIAIHVSILTQPTEMIFNSQEALLYILRPGVDGLIVQDSGLEATFLPSVWESLKTPEEFLQHLKAKAGLGEDYWSPTLRAFRYEAEVIE